jgi:branched-chain amino acid transport system substrate-binding protein
MMRLSRLFPWAVSVALIMLVLTSLGVPPAFSQAPKTIKVGVILPLSGPAASIGEYIREGMDFAAERFNAAGGVKSMGGAQIQYVYADHCSKPEVGMAEAERLILKEKIVALFGAWNSGVAMTASTVAEKYGVPFVVVLCIGDQITERGYKYTFRPHGKSGTDQKILLNFLIETGKRMKKPVEKIALVYDTTEGAQTPAKFWRQFVAEANQEKRANIKIVYDESFPMGMTDFNPVILKVKSARPDFMVLFSTATADGMLLAKNMAAQRYTPNLGVLSFGGATLDPVFVPQTGKNSEYWYTIQGWTKDLLDTSPPWAREWYDGFKKKYNKEVNGDVCKVFLDTYTLFEGLQKAGTTEGKALRDAIASLDITEGPALMVRTTKRVKFDAEGQNMYYDSGVAQITNGQYVFVYPDHIAKSGYKVVWPIPQWKDRK